MICLSFGNKDRALFEKVIANHEFIEIRLDLCDLSKEELNFFIPKIKKSIITFIGDENEALPVLLNGIESGASIIDININFSINIINQLISKAILNNCKILLSYHEYINKPDFENLKNTYISMMKFNPDFIKIVNICKKFNEYLILLEFINYIFQEKNNISTVFALGEYSKISRIFAEFLSMPIVYSSLNEQYQTIENQIAYDDFKLIMEFLK